MSWYLRGEGGRGGVRRLSASSVGVVGGDGDGNGDGDPQLRLRPVKFGEGVDPPKESRLDASCDS